MPFSDYTAPDTVRSVLGISAEEVEDTSIDNPVYLTGLLESLYDVHPSLADDYLATRSVASRSTDQNRFLLLVQTYCSYTVALQMIPSLPMSAPKEVKDGKAAITRIDNPYANLRVNVATSMSYFKDRLLLAYKLLFPARLLPTKAVRVNIISVPVGFDPVTGV